MFIKFPDGENNSFQITFETDGDGYVAVSTPDGKIHGVNMTHAQFEALGKVLLGHSRGARALPDSKTTIGKKTQRQVDFLFAAKNDLQPSGSRTQRAEPRPAPEGRQPAGLYRDIGRCAGRER